MIDSVKWWLNKLKHLRFKIWSQNTFLFWSIVTRLHLLNLTIIRLTTFLQIIVLAFVLLQSADGIIIFK